jgi:hemolysin D
MSSIEKTARILPWPRHWVRERSELEFLPAALEIIETPPSPAGRAIAATIILFFVAALTWASIGKLDIITTATGKIVPTGGTKVIQPFETGVVRAVYVQDGQAVKEGDVLVELDPTISAAESGRFAKELLGAQLDVNRLHALLDDGEDPVANFTAPDGASPEQISLQRTLLANQVEEYRAKLANLDRQIAQSEASRDGAAAEVHKLVLSIPLLQQRAAAFKTLVDHGWGEVLQYLQIQQDLVEHQQELEVQKAKLAEATASLAALHEQRRQSGAEFRRTNLSDLSEAEKKASSLQQQLVQAQERQHLQTLTAPVDGTVQQLAIHTVGGVVTPAQQLMAVVPADSHLEIEAMVSNRDIGFVNAGEQAEIKVDTFNFTKYGLLHGEVTSVSQDAIPRNQPADKSPDKQPGAESKTSEPQDQEPVYAARVSLDRTQMQVEDKLVNLSPGMAVTVEIKTGSRRVIEYLLSPLLRYRQESLRER